MPDASPMDPAEILQRIEKIELLMKDGGYINTAGVIELCSYARTALAELGRAQHEIRGLSSEKAGYKAEWIDTKRDLEAALADTRRVDTAWVIEANGSYWDGRLANEAGFDADHNQAVRFARFEDAERVKYWLLKDHAFALRTTQHIWLDNKPDAAMAATPRETE